MAIISVRLLRVFLGSALRMASFSAEHKAHLPDSGVKEGTTLNDIYVAGNWRNQSFLGITSGFTELLSGQ